MTERRKWQKWMLRYLVVGHHGALWTGVLDLILGEVENEGDELRRRRRLAVAHRCQKQWHD